MSEKTYKSKKKPLSRAESILHPVRARIITAFHDRRLTPSDVAQRMPEIPLGTVYRHINILLDAGLIEIVAERKVHGVVERTFSLVEEYTYVKREDLTADDITNLVTTLTGVVQSTFRHYVREAPMPPPDGEVAFVSKSLLLTREEYGELRKVIGSFLQKTGRVPSPEHERRLIAFFSVPDYESRQTDTLTTSEEFKNETTE